MVVTQRGGFKETRVTGAQIAMLRWLLRLVVMLGMAQAAFCADRQTHEPFDMDASLRPSTTIDRVVFSNMRQQRLQPANLCSDAVFVRRVFLDAIGTLPTLEEARDFLLDREPNKRRQLVERLLERDEFADYWAMKWCDLLRVKAEFPINMWPNAVQAYHRWIKTSIKQNLRYDQFVRTLICSSGSNFRVPQVNFYRSTQSREPEAIAQAVALTFLGERADKWPKERLAEMAKLFAYIGYKRTSEWKEEIVFFDAQKLAADINKEGPQAATLPDGTSISLTPDKDPREQFADWLIAPKNPWFARCIGNRIWFWLMGRGVVEPPDDFRVDNPPSNLRLLSILETDVCSARYDLREVYQRILNSKTYQLSSVWEGDFAKGEACFAFYPIRRLDAEVLIDAVCQITGTNEEYSSAIPEPFTFIPGSERTVALADGSITSPFLDLFGRPSRDTGQALERSNRPSPSQRLHFLNSSHIRKKIETGSKMRALFSSRGGLKETVPKLYLTILSRLPTAEELQVVEQYSKSKDMDERTAMIDLAWALFNSVEFQNHH